MEAYVKASEHDLDSLICTSLKAETNWLQSCKYDNPVTSSSLSKSWAALCIFSLPDELFEKGPCVYEESTSNLLTAGFYLNMAWFLCVFSGVFKLFPIRVLSIGLPPASALYPPGSSPDPWSEGPPAPDVTPSVLRLYTWGKIGINVMSSLLTTLVLPMAEVYDTGVPVLSNI